MPHGNDMPFAQTYNDEDGFDDVPLNQSIRFGATRADYDQMNNTMDAGRRSGDRGYQQQQPRTQYGPRGGTHVNQEQFYSVNNQMYGSNPGYEQPQ